MIKWWIHMNHKALYILYTNWTFKSILALVNKNVVILKIQKYWSTCKHLL
jgi:hypothetical protein